MLSIKKFTTTIMLGLALALTSAAFAQKAQSDPKQKESCCDMSSCCKGDSCSMKEHKEQAKNHQAKDGCCCCGSDSCDMMKDGKEKEDKPKTN